MPYPEFLWHGKTYLENHRIIAYAFELNFVNVNKLVTYIVYSYQCSKHTGLKKTNGLQKKFQKTWSSIFLYFRSLRPVGTLTSTMEQRTRLHKPS